MASLRDHHNQRWVRICWRHCLILWSLSQVASRRWEPPAIWPSRMFGPFLRLGISVLNHSQFNANPSKKTPFRQFFFHAWYGEQFLFERLWEWHDKLLSFLSRLGENSLLIFWKIWYRVIYKQTFLIIYLNLLETSCFMLISQWKEMLLLHIREGVKLNRLFLGKSP